MKTDNALTIIPDGFRIVSREDYLVAAGILIGAKARIEEIKARFEKVKKPLNDEMKKLRAEEKEALSPYEQAELQLKAMMAPAQFVAPGISKISKVRAVVTDKEALVKHIIAQGDWAMLDVNDEALQEFAQRTAGVVPIEGVTYETEVIVRASKGKDDPGD